MWITEEMSKDFEEKITWNPSPMNFQDTLDAVCDGLYQAGYRIEIRKAQL